MIEIYRKGFRLDIPTEQIVTFKKSQNLNGIQERYSFSNTGTAPKTANNKKLLELFDLPTNKVKSLMNGFTVDVVLNGSIQLRNQTLTIQKETQESINWYLLYSDNALVVKLKEQYLNAITADLKYKKTLVDLSAQTLGSFARTLLVETQPASKLFVVEEMPILINLQKLIERIFVSNGYSVYGDFFRATNTVKDYYVAPNKGVYQIYSGAGEGFSPTFDETLDAFTFLSQTLAYFNCYADIDDTYKTVVISLWSNLGNYKSSYVDYSKYYVNYQDYSFQSKLAKRNELTYSDSGTTFNSFFSNNLSSQDKAAYLTSAFGTGGLNTFDDADVQDDGSIAVRGNGAVGEVSAVRIFKAGPAPIGTKVYVGGVATPFLLNTAKPVSMRDVYTEFHKDYIDYILSPLIQYVIFRYDDILAASFSMTEVFFIEQLSSYWIPLELNFSTKKDQIVVKAMLVKKRKVEVPILNNFNSILLDFKERALFPLESLLSMYPIPPNKYPWDVVIFKRYVEDLNRLYVNDVLIPSNSLPQAFAIADLATIKIEANKPSDVTPDTNTASLYLEAVDANGGVSNEAYINIQHSGVASLESNFAQVDEFTYSRSGFDSGSLRVSPNVYYQGAKPNLNNTVNQTEVVSTEGNVGDDFNLIEGADTYSNVLVNIRPFTLRMDTDNNGLGRARATCQAVVVVDNTIYTLTERSVRNNDNVTFEIPALQKLIPSVTTGTKIKVFLFFDFDNTRGANAGSIDVSLWINNWAVDISTIKTI
jgi:hypothetical protein